MGLKMAIYGSGGDGIDGKEEDEDWDGGGKDQEFQVEQLEAVMLRMQAVKGLSPTHNAIMAYPTCLFPPISQI
jgi:hypothetical protein